MEIATAPAFTGGLLPRNDALRNDHEAVTALWSEDRSRATPIWRSRNLMELDPRSERAHLVWLPTGHPIFEGPAEQPILVGHVDASGRFSVDISARNDLFALDSGTPDPRYPIDAGVFGHRLLDANHGFADLRSAMCLLEGIDAESAAVSRALSSWHRSHSFCSACGKPSIPMAAGWQRQCGSCQRIHFPRTDPVVIMLVTHGNRLLIGRSPQWPQRMYSLLAGYMEPGETIEQAVQRESFEEAGVQVGRVRYLASQPWPFPASLMIGCRGDALTTDIRVDAAELADARWMNREELALVFDGRSTDINPPRSGSIARFLMLQWLSGRV